MTRNSPWVLGKLNVLGIFVIVLLLATAASPPSASGADDAKEKEKARADIVKMSEATLSRLYKAQPQAKAHRQRGRLRRVQQFRHEDPRRWQR